MADAPELLTREDAGITLSTLVWRLLGERQCASTASIGGGLREVRWVVNAQVAKGYHRSDLEAHGAEIAATFGLSGPGVVMLTAVNVTSHHAVTHEDATATATVGISDPTWAADPNYDAQSARAIPAPAGTVNIVVEIPQPVAPGGLLNLIATVTEAKCQAFADFAVAGTGTPSDAVTIICPREGVAEPFGGPRSMWGARVACATYDAVIAGLRDMRDRSVAPC